MEHLILSVLGFDMGSVTALTFVNMFLPTGDDPLRCLAMVCKGGHTHTHIYIYIYRPSPTPQCAHLQYYAELSLQDAERFLKYLPSVVAAACIATALHASGHPAWVRTPLSLPG
jgi:hypothetical protein